MANADEPQFVRWSEALAGLARTGLAFTENPYERERFSEVLDIAADIAWHARSQAARSGGDIAVQRDEWMKSVLPGVPGYVTPKVGVAALVGNDDGELLLIQRSDAGVWLYPTGWADIGYSPAEVAIKEVAEETGLNVDVVGLAGIVDGMQLGMRHLPMYSVLFHCRVVGGTLRAHPHECLDVGFFAANSLPHPLARDGAWVDLAFSIINGERTTPYFDAPRFPVWRSAE